ncbi:hypothetical protein ACFX19_041836 [Malus domestica]
MVKGNENPKLALEARLKVAPLLISSMSSFIWVLLDFLMCVFLPTLPLPRPGDTLIMRRLDFLDSVNSSSTVEVASPGGGDFNFAATVSTNCLDLVLANPDEFGFSILFLII